MKMKLSRPADTTIKYQEDRQLIKKRQELVWQKIENNLSGW